MTAQLVRRPFGPVAEWCGGDIALGGLYATKHVGVMVQCADGYTRAEPGQWIAETDEPGIYEIFETPPTDQPRGRGISQPRRSPSITHLLRADLISYGLTEEQADKMLAYAEEMGAKLK